MANETPIQTVEIHYSARRFSPAKISVQAGAPLMIKVVNLSKERIEFESFRLNREKVVEPGQTIVVHLPALHPGDYDFFDDFHEDVSEGVITAQ